jgi:multidrug resistance efflux pump
VEEVHAREGQWVKQGDLLLRLNTERIENEIEKLKRTIRADEEELEGLKRLMDLTRAQFEVATSKGRAEIEQAEEEIGREKADREIEIRLAQFELEDTRRDLARKKETEAQVEAEKAEARVREAEARLARGKLPVDERRREVAQRSLISIEKDFALREKELELRISQTRGQIESAAKTLANLELERGQAEVRAHVSGQITVGEVKVGDLIESGKPVFAIAQDSGFRVDAAVSTADVARIQVGMKARVKLDAFDYQRYGVLEGTVYWISPDSEVKEQAAYYLVKVRLERDVVEQGEWRGRVTLGMTGRVEILAGNEPLLSLVFKRFRESFGEIP